MLVFVDEAELNLQLSGVFFITFPSNRFIFIFKMLLYWNSILRIWQKDLSLFAFSHIRQYTCSLIRYSPSPARPTSLLLHNVARSSSLAYLTLISYKKHRLFSLHRNIKDLHVHFYIVSKTEKIHQYQLCRHNRLCNCWQ